jgi:hypothetical protein
MTIAKKLKLMDEIKRRNDERIAKWKEEKKK